MCPSCSSAQVRRSRSHSLRDRIMRLAGRIPYRCRDCNRRFFVSREADKVLEMNRLREKERFAKKSPAKGARAVVLAAMDSVNQR